MHILYGYAELFLPHCSSLKDKRKIINSIITRIRKRFNISISEVEYHNLWQRSILGFCAVSHNMAEIKLFTESIEDTLYNNSLNLETTSFVHDIISQHFLK